MFLKEFHVVHLFCFFFTPFTYCSSLLSGDGCGSFAGKQKEESPNGRGYKFTFYCPESRVVNEPRKNSPGTSCLVVLLPPAPPLLPLRRHWRKTLLFFCHTVPLIWLPCIAQVYNQVHYRQILSRVPPSLPWSRVLASRFTLLPRLPPPVLLRSKKLYSLHCLLGQWISCDHRARSQTRGYWLWILPN